MELVDKVIIENERAEVIIYLKQPLTVEEVYDVFHKLGSCLVYMARGEDLARVSFYP